MSLSELSRKALRLLLLLAAVGLAARIVVAFATYGNRFDMDSMHLVRFGLREHGLDLYGALNSSPGFGAIGEGARWPYPPAFFGWIEASNQLTRTGLPFHGLVQLPAILADVGIAFLVQDFLGRRGYGERARLGAAALVVAGPVFAITSGWHGQIDSLAILPAVVAVWLWDHPDWDRPGSLLSRHRRSRALAVGLLIGTGAAIKTVPIIAVVAFAGVIRSGREAATLGAAAVGLPALLLLPFAVADPAGVRDGLDYNGLPGVGGLSLVLQPGLAESWIEGPLIDARPSSATEWLRDWGSLLLGAGLLATAALVRRAHTAPAPAAALTWLVVMALAPALFPHYAIWLLPFLLMAGMLRLSLAIEAMLLLPMLLAFWVEIPAEVPVFVTFMLAVWLIWVLAAVRLGLLVVRGARAG